MTGEKTLNAAGLLGAVFADWVENRAASLWFGSGFNRERGLFYERLSLNGQPADPPALRLMPQCRQLASSAQLAVWLGRPEYYRRALSVMARLEELYHARDGAPGWIFSIAQQGEMADKRRDLYTHAFVLFALAVLGRAAAHFGDGDSFAALKARSWRAGEGIFSLFASTGAEPVNIAAAGLREVLPRQAGRLQNPHMHLLEACLALHAAFGNEIWKKRVEALLAVGMSRFRGQAGFILEAFGEDWEPPEKTGENRVEPGHQFEWIWLIGEYLASPVSEGIGAEKRAEYLATTRRWFEKALACGLDGQRCAVLDAVLENGSPNEKSVRLWPVTELMRLLAACPGPDNVHPTGLPPKARKTLVQRLMERFFRAHAGFAGIAPGGWMDRLDGQDRPLLCYMPATSLYHALGAAGAVISSGW